MRKLSDYILIELILMSICFLDLLTTYQGVCVMGYTELNPVAVWLLSVCAVPLAFSIMFVSAVLFSLVLVALAHRLTHFPLYVCVLACTAFRLGVVFFNNLPQVI